MASFFHHLLKRLKKPAYYLPIAAVVMVGAYLSYAQSHPTLGATLTVHTGDFNEQVSVTGTVIAAENADLGFSQSGRISGVYAKVGDSVYAGQIIASIENGDLVAAVTQKEAALEAEQAKLASLTEGTRPEQLAIDQASVTSAESAVRDAVRSALVAADDAIHVKTDQFFVNARTNSPSIVLTVSDSMLVYRLQSERAALEPMLQTWVSDISSASFSTTDPLALANTAQARLTSVAFFLEDASKALSEASPSGSYTQSNIDTFKSDINSARTTIASVLSSLSTDESALTSARGTLTLAEAGSTASDLAAEAAQVKVAEAEVANAKAALGKTVVTAPFTGIISKMDAKKGEIVSANTSEISILSTGRFEIETYLSELSIAGVAIGNDASVTLDAYGTGVSFPAKVVTVDPAETVKNGVPTYKTTLIFTNADARIRSGMTANVLITTGIKPHAIVVPQGAVVTAGGAAHVTLLTNGKAVEQPVTTGTVSALGQVEILSGLTDGDVILLTP
jgi:membrane fusion protein (multidrug efflux system)